MTTRRTILAATISVPLAVPALAQSGWTPNRPITLVVGFPPGGQTDFAARVLQPMMQTNLGVPVVIDNRGGASGNIGTEYVMNSRPDGYTLLVGNNSPMTINPHTMDGMTIDPRVMLAVGNMLQSSLLLCAHPSMNVSNVAELRAWIGAQPRGSINYGSSSAGAMTHVAMELLRERLGHPEMTHVPYRGSGPAMQDFIANRFSLMFDAASVVAPFIQANQIRGVLATGATPSAAFPNVLTAAAQGIPNFTFYAWIGLFTAAGTPPEIINRLNAALNAAMTDPATAERITSRGDELGGGTPDHLATMLARDHQLWGDVVRTNNIRASA